MKLIPRVVEKPWGRTVLPSSFGGLNSSPIGEIWFEHPDAQDLPLLIKYIFTNEKLSVQVHPNDAQARARGLPRGKNECWYVIEADPGASLGLGLRSSISPEKLRSAAIGGSIEGLMEWRPVRDGDFFYVPAGTVHAIGAGITLLEVQQNSDVTYRLYDYGRPRELHLEDGIAVAKPGRFDDENFRAAGGPLHTTFVDGPHFTLVRASSVDQIPPSLDGQQKWVLPLEGQVTSNDTTAVVGECLLVAPGGCVSFSPGAVVIVAAESSQA